MSDPLDPRLPDPSAPDAAPPDAVTPSAGPADLGDATPGGPDPGGPDPGSPDPGSPDPGSPDPGSPGPDAAWVRLQAADPVAGHPEPDLTAVRARVLDEVVGAALDTAAGGADEHDAKVEDADDGATVTHLAGAGRRPTSTGRRLLAVAASVALLAGVGVAGVALGRATADEVPLAAGYPIPALNSGPGSPVGGQAAPPQTGAGTDVATATGSAEDARMSMPWYGGRVLLEPAAGLSDDAGVASGWRYDTSGVDPRQAAARLAAAFGVSGDPVAQDGSWVVGSVDGSEPNVWVGTDGLASWWFSDPQGSPWYCPEPVPEPAVEPAQPGSPGGDPAAGSDTAAGSGPAADSEPAPPDAACPSSSGPAVPAEEAERIARRTFADLGLDVDAAVWRSTTDGTTTSVTAMPTVAGRESGMVWSMEFGSAREPYSASGWLAVPVEVPGYPVVGARTAVLRSLDPRWSVLGPTPVYREDQARPLAAADTGVATSADTSAATGADTAVSSAEGSGSAAAGPGAGAAPVTGTDGRPVVEVPVEQATITAARLDLTQYWQPDGTLLLLPAYLLTADDGRAWSMLALTDADVRFVPAPTDVGGPVVVE